MLLLIANDASLGAEWLDHALKGDWADHKECHISGNFLLLYQVEANWINFVRPAPIPSCSAVDRLLMARNWHCSGKKTGISNAATQHFYSTIFITLSKRWEPCAFLG